MEGPPIVILRAETALIKGKIIIDVSGNSKIEQHRLLNQKVFGFKSWGKHFLIVFSNFLLKVHFLMFGSYRINERKENPRLSLKFKNGELNLYNCSVKIIEGNYNSLYDEELDVKSDQLNEKKAITNLNKMKKKTHVCDVLLDQQIFAGVGNIIKNEVLFRIKIHPGSFVGSLSDKSIKQLVKAARNYNFNFF